MQIHSNSITDGHLGDSFGHRGTQFYKNKMPSRSFQLSWKNVPKETVSLALVFIDYDAVPVCGFPWIHWTVANIDPNLGELPENASVEKQLLEGVNSWNSGIISEDWRLDKEGATGYGGCAPPDQPHRYTLDVYALDSMLNLKRGFYLNELLKSMEGHVLDKTTLHAIYKTR
ncbi:MAG: hypothetical protein ACD_60C00022G0009 [uncultured bacterium]|nr:MAG: hypothetical protein ACD_60C00022G0009 [uncultured bacterium]